jgi:SEC-C motif domain protein
MRSRYSAFTLGLGDYLTATRTGEVRFGEAAELSRFAKSVVWLGLAVHSAQGGPTDAQGQVSFTARYLESGSVVTLHETSDFTRADGRWRYEEGAEPEVTTVKVERNSQCPCGSGKKFKQCHA